MSADEFERLWKHGGFERNEIRKAYERVPGSLNTNSMTLFSGVKREEIMQITRHNCVCYRNGCGAKQSGCLYMGDYDASGSNKWSQLKSVYDE